ncbi:MAG: DUF1573 domain-containing protein [Bacteroidales bacterium]|nr:DUF1573 domain-containing protein [Bacteroidales bacterium]
MKTKNKKLICILVIVLSIGWILLTVGSSIYEGHTPVRSIEHQSPAVKDTMQGPLSALSINKNTVNFGDISGDTVLSAQFILHNESLNPLIIEYVNPDCSCTNYSISKYRIESKDTATVHLNVDTRNKAGSQVLRSVIKANTREEMYMLTVRFNVIR